MYRVGLKGPGAAFLAMACLYAASAAIVCAIAAQGLPYYLTPVAERAHHPGYWVWKAGGRAGHQLGWIGAAMLVLLLGYSLRKRVRLLHGIGPLSRWLDVHIFLGLVGPSLIVLHSAFKVGGLVALSFWSMVAVACSGVLGRFLYLQIPRTRAGEALTLAELEAADQALSRRLRAEFGLGDEALSQIERIADLPADAGLLRTLFRLALSRHFLRRQVAGFVQQGGRVPSRLLGAFERLARQKAQSRWRIKAYDRAQELFHYWHVFHKPFAVVMYIFLIVHVAVAWATGYAGFGHS